MTKIAVSGIGKIARDRHSHACPASAATAACRAVPPHQPPAARAGLAPPTRLAAARQGARVAIEAFHWETT